MYSYLKIIYVCYLDIHVQFLLFLLNFVPQYYHAREFDFISSCCFFVNVDTEINSEFFPRQRHYSTSKASWPFLRATLLRKPCNI